MTSIYPVDRSRSQPNANTYTFIRPDCCRDSSRSGAGLCCCREGEAPTKREASASATIRSWTAPRVSKNNSIIRRMPEGDLENNTRIVPTSRTLVYNSSIIVLLIVRIILSGYYNIIAAVGEDETGRSADHCVPCSVHSTIGSCLLQGSGTDAVARGGSKEQQLLDTIARDLERTIEVRAMCCCNDAYPSEVRHTAERRPRIEGRSSK